MNARPVHHAASPLQLLLQAHEQATGHRERRTGNATRITCAACGTHSYKVSVTEASNGSVLLHAFCGHHPHEVLGAMGLQMADLFQRRDLRTFTPAERSQTRQAALLPRWRAALEVLQHEVTVLLIAANKLGDGEALDDAERTRLGVAALKVFDAGEVLHAR
jgi:hypothetical protein